MAIPNLHQALIPYVLGDLVGLIEHFGEWHMSLFRPDKVRGLVALAVPYFPRSSQIKSVESIRQLHVVQFQEPRTERAFAKYDHMMLLKKWWLITKKESISAPAATIDNREELQLNPVDKPSFTEYKGGHNVNQIISKLLRKMKLVNFIMVTRIGSFWHHGRDNKIRVPKNNS